jgi:hypothetical protein
MRAGGAASRVGAALVAGAMVSAVVPAPAAGAPTAVPRTYPFRPPSDLRAPKRRDALPHLYGDGRACSTGCRPSGAVPGWPVIPFHRQHVLRAGLNELRTANFHLGVDILAGDGARVYAMQPGRAHVQAAFGADARVRVGRFIYWHIYPRVRTGQYVRSYSEVVGRVLPGMGHVHLSEVLGSRYLNPLRPGGRVLSPWRDTARPILGRPRFGRAGYVEIRGFDPQSSRRSRSQKPVLALAGLAYRLFDGRGRRVGPLRWALRGTQHLPAGLRRVVYAPGSHANSAKCSNLPRPCRPNWNYRLAGGLAPRLRLRPGRVYTLTAYAWDWKGRASALDTRVRLVGGKPRVLLGS